jgi:hypothetical protein
LYSVQNDFDNATNSNIVATFTGTGRFGVGVLSPLNTVHVNGGFRANSLAGVGNRALSTNASGDIIVNTSSTTKYWITNGYEFHSTHANFHEGDIAYVNSVSSTTKIYAVVHLPHQASVISVYFNYGDVSTTDNLRMRFVRIDNPGNFIDATLAEINSSGSASQIIQNTDGIISNPIIDNINYTYVLLVEPAIGSSWDSNKINIRNVRIAYTEQN